MPSKKNRFTTLRDTTADVIAADLDKVVAVRYTDHVPGLPDWGRRLQLIFAGRATIAVAGDEEDRVLALLGLDAAALRRADKEATV